MFSKIEGEPALVRDEKTKAILNVDNESLKAYKKRRELMMQQQEEIQTLKADVKEMKLMLKQLLDSYK